MATGTGATARPVVVPAPSRRPGSATWSDAYGALAFPGQPTTGAAGGEGASRTAAASAAGEAPLSLAIGPDFLKRPAGTLVVLLLVLLVWSYLEPG